MKKLFIVANLKSYKNLEEGRGWVENFLENKKSLQSLKDKEIILCPSFTLLANFSSSFLETNIEIGAQNVSSFDEGAYTGEVNAKQIKDFARYVIIGHSERRKNFAETDDILKEKVKLAVKNNLIPIFCVQDEKTFIPEGVKIIAYEPIFAIGSGNPDTPENAENVARSFAQKNSDYQVLYGGSVTSANVQSFTNMEHIKGVLVGGACLDAEEFINIIKNA